MAQIVLRLTLPLSRHMNHELTIETQPVASELCQATLSILILERQRQGRPEWLNGS